MGKFLTISNLNDIFGRVKKYVDSNIPPQSSNYKGVIAVRGVRPRYGGEMYLEITGHKPLLEAGYVPYLVEWRRKRDTHSVIINDGEGLYFKPTKYGWSLYGGENAIRIIDGRVNFFKSQVMPIDQRINYPDSEYEIYPSRFLGQGVQDNQANVDLYYWKVHIKGKSKILSRQYAVPIVGGKKVNRFYSARRKFGIAFCPKRNFQYGLPTPTLDLSTAVSNIAEFDMVYTWPPEKVIDTYWNPPVDNITLAEPKIIFA